MGFASGLIYGLMHKIYRTLPGHTVKYYNLFFLFLLILWLLGANTRFPIYGDEGRNLSG